LLRTAQDSDEDFSVTAPCFTDAVDDVSSLREAIDRLNECDPSAYADSESIVALYRERARLDAFVSAAAASFDAAGHWVPDGARSAAAWITTRCRLPKSVANAMVRRGRRVRNLLEVERAWAEGDITADQVDVIAAARTPVAEEALARDEEMLVDQATRLPYQGFVQAMAYWTQLADPDGTEEDDEKRRARRDVYLAQSFEGMWLGKTTLDPISGSVVSEELGRLEQQLFEMDWADARAELGRDPTAADLARTPGQRRADALVEMAVRSHVVPPNSRRPTPLFTVLVNYETLSGRVCELADGTVVSPGSLLPWLDQAMLERVVFAPDGRAEVSHTARLFTGGTRRGIEVRDRTCTHSYCDVPASRCQVDHIIPYSEGGLAVEENGQMLCGFHNRLRTGRPPP
jgi:hypothetical protein